MAAKNCKGCSATFTGENAETELEQHVESFHPAGAPAARATTARAASGPAVDEEARDAIGRLGDLVVKSNEAHTEAITALAERVTALEASATTPDDGATSSDATSTEPAAAPDAAKADKKDKAPAG